MGRIAAEYFVELDDLLVGREVLGKSITVKRDTHRFLLEIPTSPTQFEFARVNLQGADPREAPSVVAFVGSVDAQYVTLKIIRIVVNVESDLSVETYDKVRGEARLQEVFMQAWGHAHDAAREFVDFVRVRGGQPWIAPSGKYPPVV